MTCPKCKANTARRAQRVGFLDNAANRFSFKPYACAACGHRFHALDGPLTLRSVAVGFAESYSRLFDRRSGTRARRELYFYLAGCLIFAVLMYVFTRPTQ